MMVTPSMVQNWYRDKAAKLAMLRGQIERMPDSPQKEEMLNQIDDAIRNPLGSAAQAVENKLDDLVEDIRNETLDMVRGLGAAIVEGIDGAADAVAAKLHGKEPAVIAGITTAAIGLLTVILLYNTAKKGI